MDIYLIYLRKSRADSDMTVEEVLKRHESMLQDYAERELGHRIPEEFIYREVVSGETIDDRPMVQQVLRLMELNSVKGVLVADPQRLTRGDLVDCGRIINAFRYSDTLVITPRFTFNLAQEYDRKFFEMELSRGNDYLEYSKRIMNSGRIESIKHGNFIGSIAPYGYERVTTREGKIESHTLKVVEEEADGVRIMFDLYVNKHYGFANIAHELDSLGIHPRNSEHWNPAAIKDMLENPVYIGKVRWNYRKTVKKMVNGQVIKVRPKNKYEGYQVYDGKHEAIISESLFNASLERRGRNIIYRPANTCSNPFAGLIKCQCGRAMSYKPYYNRQRTKPILVCDDQVHCHTRAVSFDAVKDEVVKTLESSIENFRTLLKNDDGGTLLREHRIASLKAELEKLDQKDIRQKDAFDEGIYSKEEYIMQNSKLQKRRAEVTAALAKAADSEPAVDYKNKLVQFTDALNAMTDDSVSAGDKNIYLKQVIDRIVYSSKGGRGNRWAKNEFEVKIYIK